MKWKPPKKYPCVAVEWVDSQRPVAGWQWIDEIGEPEPALCVTLGFLVGESAAAVSIAGNVGDLEFDRSQACGVITIPKVAIKKMVKL